MALTFLAVTPVIETIKSFAVDQVAVNDSRRTSVFFGSSLLCIAINSSISVIPVWRNLRLVMRAEEALHPKSGATAPDGESDMGQEKRARLAAHPAGYSLTPQNWGRGPHDPTSPPSDRTPVHANSRRSCLLLRRASGFWQWYPLEFGRAGGR